MNWLDRWNRDHRTPFKFHQADSERPVYLRYGLWSRRSVNAVTMQRECGVSVYRALLVDGVVVPDDDISLQLVDEGRVVFAVQGNEVGVGSDGEPCLARVKPIRNAIALEARR
jgi:hypothetical protein